MPESDRASHSASQASPVRKHILTVAVEDYFHASAFSRSVGTHHWHRFEPRVIEGTYKALDLLDEYGAQATFFALGWVAEQAPAVLREIVRRGHEVASKGHLHRSLKEMGPDEFRDEVRKSRAAIEAVTGVRVVGYRVAQGHMTANELWALDILAEEGYLYDSSFFPRLRSTAEEPWRRFPFEHRAGAHPIHELPLATANVAGWHVPIAGGAYLRNMPRGLVRRLVAQRVREHPTPLVMYFHAWELDPEVPRITAASRFARFKQYRNIEQMPERLREYLQRYPFVAIRDYLGLASQPAIVAGADLRVERDAPSPAAPTTPVTIVVPCFNEEKVLPYLANTLRLAEQALAPSFRPEYVFVDDRSTDNTWQVLHDVFGSWPRCQFVRHPTNLGVARAILTGLAHARTEIAGSIDCDCSYDPRHFADLFARLADNVAVVTASPYHPDGRVHNVPAWRLALSKSCSYLYRRVTRQKLHTYTSCFRAYRRELIEDVGLREGGYLGLAELLLALDQQGRRIAECPAVLESRLLGHSKMKTLRTIRGHLRLLWRFATARALPGPAALPADLPR